MSFIEDKIARLTPKQRALLELRLSKRRTLQVPDAIEPQPKAEYYPASFAQERLWYVDQLKPGTSAFNLSNAVILRGPLSPALLRQAFTEVVRRHEALRTTFAENGGRPVQIVEHPKPVELPYIDLQSLLLEQRRPIARQLATKETLRAFDLSQGPLLRGLLIRIDRSEHLIICVVHHIVSDVWSLRILLRDLTAFYTAMIKDQPPMLPALPVQYRDFTLWQRQWLQGPQLEEQRTYWQQKLAGAPKSLKLPVDYPERKTQSFHGTQQTFKLSSDLTADLIKLSSREKSSLFMLSLAVYQLLMHHHSRSDSIVVSSPISIRNWHEIQNLVGFFVNMLPFVSSFAGDPSFRELLAQVRKTAMEAFNHQHIPLQELIKSAVADRSLDQSFQSPFLQLSLNFIDGQIQDADIIPGLEVEYFQPEIKESQYDMNLILFCNGVRLQGWWQYRTDFFSDKTIGSMIEQFRLLLGKIIENPDARLSQLLASLRIDEEKRRAETKHELKRVSSERFARRRRKSIKADIL